MASTGTPFARIVLLGLDDSLAGELRAVLGRRQDVYTEAFLSGHECLRTVERLGAALIFCAADPSRYLDLLDAVRREKPDLPVVVVSRAPEVSEWLDAIEAGASDYCAAPFEPAHIQWILDSNLRHHSAPTRYRAAG